MLFNSRRAQSTLEYILVLSAIVGVIIWGAVSILQPKVKQAFTDIDKSIAETGKQIAPK